MKFCRDNKIFKKKKKKKKKNEKAQVKTQEK